jgi:hypothetical protein
MCYYVVTSISNVLYFSWQTTTAPIHYGYYSPPLHPRSHTTHPSLASARRCWRTVLHQKEKQDRRTVLVKGDTCPRHKRINVPFKKVWGMGDVVSTTRHTMCSHQANKEVVTRRLVD